MKEDMHMTAMWTRRALALLLAALLALSGLALAEEAAPEAGAAEAAADDEVVSEAAEALPEVLEDVSLDEAALTDEGEVGEQDGVALPEEEAEANDGADKADPISVSLSFSRSTARYGEPITASWQITGAVKPYREFGAEWYVDGPDFEDPEDWCWMDVAATADPNATSLSFTPVRGRRLSFDLWLTDAEGRYWEWEDMEDEIDIPITNTWPQTSFVITGKTSKTLNLRQNAQIVLGEGLAARSYATSNKKVAKVSKTGLITPVKAGAAKITITLKNKKKIVLTLTVVDPNAPQSVRFYDGEEVITRMDMVAGEVYDELAEDVELLPYGATTGKLTWSTSNKKVVTVSKAGVLKAVGPGSAKITVKTANGRKTSLTVNVRRNKIDNINPRPAASEVYNYHDRVMFRLKSVEIVNSKKVVVEYYIINGYSDKLKKITSFHHEVWFDDEDGWNPTTILKGTIKSKSLNMKALSIGTVKLTFTGSMIRFTDVDLTRLSPGQLDFYEGGYAWHGRFGIFQSC